MVHRAAAEFDRPAAKQRERAMSITVQVLGDPGRDNAVLMQQDSGQGVARLLFDCGDGCVSRLPVGTVQEIDHVFFSHFHMDHVAGFDAFFRCTYNRTARLNHLWGPPGSAEVLSHRFRGYLWNLHGGQAVSWFVHEIHEDRVRTTRFALDETFARPHAESDTPRQPVVLDAGEFTVEALAMDHGTPSLAYVVREAARVNVDPAKLAALGLPPGPWLKRVRGPRAEDKETITVDGATHRVAELQDALVTTTPGESAAYLTDFLLDDAAQERLAAALRGVMTVVSECQYRHADLDLARRNYHMTATQVAETARHAGVGRLVLFHLSDRYTATEWLAILAEAKGIFPATSFPEAWGLPGA
jgi:ribonuclease Z